MQTIIGMEPHIMVIGMPQFIIWVIMSQHILSMSMLIMPVGIMVQLMPLAVISNFIDGVIAMPQQLIIGIPAQVIMQDMPLDIIDVIIVHMSFIMSMVVPSPGIIMHIMPCAVISQLMRQLIGIIIAIGMFDMPVMFIGIEVIGIEGIALMKFS